MAACYNNGSDKAKQAKQESSTDKAKPTKKVENHNYQALAIPEFFNQLTANHQSRFKKLPQFDYKKFCQTNGLKFSDSGDLSHYFTMRILHELFTSNSTKDYSQGPILNIPYLWHWIDPHPNPRSSVIFLKNDKRLKNIEPPNRFSQYPSYAKIDRTPFIFEGPLR